MRSLTVLAVLTVLAGVAAADSFEITDHGDTVEVVVRGAIAADGARVGVVRERLELPLARATGRPKVTSEDATVRLAEIRGRSERTLSIKLRHEHDGVAALAPGVRFLQIGDELHVTIPRRPPPPAAAPPAPPIAGIVATAPPVAVTADEVPPAPAPVAAPAPTPVSTTPAPPLGDPRGSATSMRWWMILGGLALAGAGVTALLRRNRGLPAALEQLEIIATRSLGGKARLIWVAAGDRELMMAVSPQGVSSLGSWPRSARAAAISGPMDFDRTLAEAEQAPPPPALPRASATLRRGTAPGYTPGGTGVGSTDSPAISGLLRLRDRRPPRASESDFASVDELDDDDGGHR